MSFGSFAQVDILQKIQEAKPSMKTPYQEGGTYDVEITDSVAMKGVKGPAVIFEYKILSALSTDSTLTGEKVSATPVGSTRAYVTMLNNPDPQNPGLNNLMTFLCKLHDWSAETSREFLGDLSGAIVVTSMCAGKDPNTEKNKQVLAAFECLHEAEEFLLEFKKASVGAKFHLVAVTKAKKKKPSETVTVLSWEKRS
jgi:hypothetical protein